MSATFDVILPTAIDGVPPRTEPVSLALDAPPPSGPFGPYVLPEKLATAVNVALALNQPLLVTGEPGCGKTSLAWAVAAQLGTEVLEFHTKSTSVARDLFYTFDSLRRFHDASTKDATARDAAHYVEYQALGKAIRSDRTCVVLVDEIDKAPRDFPNDLLNEIDRKQFTVPEVVPPVTFCQKAKHFVLVTSNSERRLPVPFLRRCVYVHIPFPDDAMLRRIIDLHAADWPLSQGFVDLAVQRFLALREVEGLAKRPSTGELVAWVRVLGRMGIPEDQLRTLPAGRLPALEALIKTVDDLQLLRSADGA